MNDERITEAQIKELLRQGRLHNLFKWHHYKQVTACALGIETAITRLEESGFSGFEIYYALYQHLIYTRFALEDSNLEEGMKIIDNEIVTDALEHRKKYSKEFMQRFPNGNIRPEGSSEEIQP